MTMCGTESARHAALESGWQTLPAIGPSQIGPEHFDSYSVHIRSIQFLKAKNILPLLNPIMELQRHCAEEEDEEPEVPKVLKKKRKKGEEEEEEEEPEVPKAPKKKKKQEEDEEPEVPKVPKKKKKKGEGAEQGAEAEGYAGGIGAPRLGC